MSASEAARLGERKESMGTFNLEQHHLTVGEDLKHTRAIIDAIHDGALAKAKTERDPIFGFDVPTECPGVPRDILWSCGVWADPSAYDTTARKLADLFRESFKKYESGVSAEIKAAGPA